MQDTLSDMLVRIKNAQASQKEDVHVIDSKFNRRICDVLVDEGFIESFETIHVENIPYISIKLKYFEGKSVINQIKRISKPSLRVYAKCGDIPKSIDGFGIIVISTPNGVMSNHKAISANLGGELLFSIS